MSLPIADLHCDLLSFLASDEHHSALDPDVHCSIPQLHAGNVHFQTLAIGYETKIGSAALGMHQARCFERLLEEHCKDVVAIDGSEELRGILKGHRIGVITSIENASAFCEEQEPIRAGLKRFQEFIRICRPLYVSFTWNSENRFGGGALTDVGLKIDGKALLDFLDGRQIAVDFSHASDRLVHDILEYIAGRNLDIDVMASHSNVRTIKDVARNLPDDLLREIFKRGGIVGCNFIRAFVGSKKEDFAKHIAAIMALGGEDQVCFGADFFYGGDAPANTPGRSPEGWFFPEWSNSGCYGNLLALLKGELALSDVVLEKLAYRNAFTFFSRLRQPEHIAIS